MIKYVLSDETCTFKFDKDYGPEFDDFEERYPWIKEVEENFIIGPKMGKFTIFPLNDVTYVFLHCVENGVINDLLCKEAGYRGAMYCIKHIIKYI